MRLATVRVQNFRSIDDTGEVVIEPGVTALMGQNESGKTSFLQALYLSRPATPAGGFEVDRDYPRKSVNDYRPRHDTKPDPVAILTYELNAEELAAVNSHLGTPLLESLKVSTTHHYKNGYTVGIRIDEAPYLRHLMERAPLSADTRAEVTAAPSLRAALAVLATKDLTSDGREFVATLQNRFRPDECKWESLLEYEVWSRFVKPALPKFFYFDEYSLLPGKANLKTLAVRATEPTQQTDEDRTLLALLELAGVSLPDLTTPQRYEQIKARLEGLQNAVTDRIVGFWSQNPELEIEFDIREDPQDKPPFDQGANLYLRVRNRRHRVTVPFSQRSKGFIWFFSFLVRFDALHRKATSGDKLVLLLDEPGHSLHAVAQRDCLRYIDQIAETQQVIYATHSPFLVRGDRMDRVRIVEDVGTEGTLITTDLTDADANTLLPLRAAVGYSVAENLLPTDRNLIVSGPTELVYLSVISSALERAGRIGLRPDIALVPAGGLGQLAAILALVGGGPKEFAVLRGSAEETHTTPPGLRPKSLLAYAQFRDLKVKGKAAPPPQATDIEDLLGVPLYLKLFNTAFGDELSKEIKETDLPTGERILQRLESHLNSANIVLRTTGSFDRYAVATHFAANPPKALDKDTLARFEELFKKVNALLPTAD